MLAHHGSRSIVLRQSNIFQITTKRITPRVILNTSKIIKRNNSTESIKPPRFESVRRLFLVSKTRLKVKSFWPVFSLFFGVCSYAYLTQINDEEIDRLVETISTSSDLQAIYSSWDSVYSELLEVVAWERFIKRGIIELGFLQLHEASEINIDSASFSKIKHELDSISPGTDQYNELVALAEQYTQIILITTIIAKTMSRICAVEELALYAVKKGAFEKLTDVIVNGISNPHIGNLWNTLLAHKTVQEELLQRPEFYDKIQLLIETKKEDPFLFFYELYIKFGRNPEVREKLKNDERFQEIVNLESGNEWGIGGIFNELRRVDLPPRYWWSILNTKPVVQTFETKKDLYNNIASCTIFCVLGAAYCGVRWKRTLPHLSNGILLRKMLTGFVGMGAMGFMPVLGYYFVGGPNVMVHPRPKNSPGPNYIGPNNSGENVGPNGEIVYGPDNFYAPYRIEIADHLRVEIPALLYFWCWYNSKFILLPAVAQFLFNLFRLPTQNEIEEGDYIKFVFIDKE